MSVTKKAIIVFLKVGNINCLRLPASETFGGQMIPAKPYVKIPSQNFVANVLMDTMVMV